MGHCPKNRNFMDELRNIICTIETLKPEPEVCNTRCPPFGCPRGPCPGMCCYNGVCDPCCVSKMPCCPPPPNPPYCCAPASLLKSLYCNPRNSCNSKHSYPLPYRQC